MASTTGRWGALLSLSLLLLAPEASAQEAGGASYASYHRAREVLEEGLRALGGEGSVPEARGMVVTLEGTRFLRGQSLRAGPAYDTFPTTVRLVIDDARGRLLQEEDDRMLGGYRFHIRRVLDGGKGFAVDLQQSRFGDEEIELSRSRISGVRASVYRNVPHLLLRGALGRPATLRYLGRVEDGGREQQLVSFVDEDGVQLTLYLDARTHLLSKHEVLRDHPILGDLVAETVFAEYRAFDGLKLPGRVVVRENGEVLKEMRATEVAVNPELPDSLFRVPPGYRRVPPSSGPASVTPLSDGVYLIDRLGGGYKTIFVDLEEYVVLLEAPLSSAASESAIGLIRQTLPGKPIRYVVATHHHADHIGGLRPHVAHGVTILAPQGAVAPIRALVAAPRTLAPDALSRAPREPVVEVVSGRRSLGEGERRIEIFSVGGTSHVDEDLIVYLPGPGVLFQGDMWTLPDHGPVPAAIDANVDLAEAIRRLGLDVRVIVGAHGRIASTEELREALAKRELRRAGEDGGHR